MKLKSEILKWINEEPDQSDVEDSPEGGKHIPIEKLQILLDRLDPSWGVKNFKVSYPAIMGETFVDASVELIVSYGGISRTLAGAATFKIPPPQELDANTHYAATGLANAVKNASKRLGKRFGSMLNKGEDTYSGPAPKGRVKRNAVKLQPDAGIIRSYLEAIASGDADSVGRLESIYTFQKF